MEKSKIDMFLAVHADKFAPEHLLMLQEQLEQFPDDKSMILNAQDFKSPSTMMLISIFLGGWGIDCCSRCSLPTLPLGLHCYQLS